MDNLTTPQPPQAEVSREENAVAHLKWVVSQHEGMVSHPIEAERASLLLAHIEALTARALAAEARAGEDARRLDWLDTITGETFVTVQRASWDPNNTGIRVSDCFHKSLGEGATIRAAIDAANPSPTTEGGL